MAKVQAKRLTIAKVKQALEATHGIYLAAAQYLGVSRGTLYNFKKAHPELDEFENQISEGNIDFVENKLLKAIKNDDLTGIIFYLKTKGKRRGYVERQELTGADGETLGIKLPENMPKCPES